MAKRQVSKAVEPVTPPLKKEADWLKAIRLGVSLIRNVARIISGKP